MATLAQIRAGIKETIEHNVPGITVYRTAVEVAHPPAVVVALAQDGTADFDKAMGRGVDTWQWDLFVLTALRDGDIGQDDLDEFIDGGGDKSIRKAIFLNRTLGLTNTDAHVSTVSGYGSHYETIDIQHIGAVLRLIVHTRGD